MFLSDPKRTATPDETPTQFPGWGWLAVIFAAALAYRGLCYGVMGDHVLLRQPVVDAAHHDAWAIRIAAGDWLGSGSDDVFKPPLYPYLLGAMYRLFGRHIAYIQWGQYFLGACSCVLVALLGGRLLGRWTGRIAGLACSFYAPWVFDESQLLSPVLSIFLNSAALLLLVSFWDRRRYRWLLAGGLALGLSIATRPDVLLPAALLLGWLLWRDRRLPCRRIAAGGLSIVGGVALALLPVALRNHTLTGQWIAVSANGGINFYVGNVATDGTTAVPVGLQWDRLISRMPQEVLEKPATASRWWAARTWQEASAQPAATLQRLGRKTMAFFNGREFRNNICFHFMQREIWPLRPPALQWGWVIPPALCGLVLLALSRRGEHRFAAGTCGLWVAGYWATGVAFFVTGRFRLPATPVLIIAAAWALQSIVLAARRRRWRTIALQSAVVLLAGMLAWPDWFGRPSDYWAEDYVNLGNSHRSAGDMQAAEQAYRQTLAIRPDDADANFLLGRCLLGRDPAALVYLLAADRSLPDSPDVLVALGSAYQLAGRQEEARQALQRLLDLSSRRNLYVRRNVWAAAHIQLATLTPSDDREHWRQAWTIDPQTAAESAFLQQRDLPRVMETFRDLACKKPWDWYSQANYGLVLLAMGRPADAVEPLRQACRLDSRPKMRFYLARALLASGQLQPARQILQELCRNLPAGPMLEQARHFLTAADQPRSVPPR